MVATCTNANRNAGIVAMSVIGALAFKPPKIHQLGVLR